MSADVSVAVIGAVAVVIASIIGLIVAVTTAVITKEQKISEFRQAWINDFRTDIAKLLSFSYELIFQSRIDNLKPKKEQRKDNVLLSFLTTYVKIEEKATSIILRLNKSEHSEIIGLIENLVRNEHIDGVEVLNLERLHKLILMIEIEAQKILKSEWERVKRGEGKFTRFKKAGKFLASTLMVAIYVLFVIALIKSPVLSL